MASSPCGNTNFDSGLEIKTRSVEQTLIPLVSQITTLINHKDKPNKSERTLAAIHRVGQAVSVAVGRFVAVGEAIASENQELKDEMGQACFEARRAGDAIAQLTDAGSPFPSQSEGCGTVFNDRTGMVKAARLLLSSVTKVLVLADRIVIKQIITSRNKVLVTLDHLERVSTFQEFVQIFSQFGNEMVEFAHLTGDRQNDLKDEKKKARMAAARAVLEKCTMMLLTASKTCLRHPDCESARINKDAVFQRMRCALEQVIEIVTEARSCGENKILPASIYNGIKDFKSNVECLRENLYTLSPQSMGGQLEALVEQTEDFTDSAYTSHEQRQAILGLCQLARQDTQQLVHAWVEAQSVHAKEATEGMEVAILKTCQSLNDLRRELHKVTVCRTTDLLKVHGEHLPLRALKAAGAEGNLEAVAEYSRTLTEQKEQLVETCRLLCHVSGTEPLEITCIHAEETFHVIGPQIISAAQTLALHPSSKIAKENLEVFCEAWESQLCDMALLLREINDVFEEKRSYLSLPRAGVSFSHSHPHEYSNHQMEQSSMAKLGLELRLLSSDVDTEVEKWEEQEHNIVRQSQSLASMAYNMYLFTRGEGLLKTTLDLFHQAEVLSEEGLQLCSSFRTFSTQLVDEEKSVVMTEMEKVVAFCQQLQMGGKTPVQGKTATFQKVDSSIQATRGILTVVLYLLPFCNKLNKKYKSERSSLGSPQDWRERQDASTPVKEEGALHIKNSNGFGVKCLEQHIAGFKHPGEQIILCSLSSIGAAHSKHHLSGEQVIQKISSLPSSSCTPKEWVKAACEDGSLGSGACICCLDDEVEGRFKLNVLRGSFNQKISSTPVHKMETISYDFCSEPPSRERILTQPDF
ncbi:alpha-catulin isoform X4 [Gymnodraco acuticeps]|uniref:Alpha-catulin n=1 Tax=Gymnodraco acuticeps TaxID=8218 RepID=A0A6P8VZX4_GYMAC|nr:alpha-catulin isoform X4 [Gymnodraco acuticeps]